MTPFWPTTLLGITRSCYWKLHLVMRDVQLGLCLPIIGIFLYHLHIYMCLEASTILGFHTNPQMPLIFSCLCPYPLPLQFSCMSLGFLWKRAHLTEDIGKPNLYIR